MENCLVKGNKSKGTGGATIYVNSTSAKIVNCTVVGNTEGTYRGIRLAAAGHVYNTVMHGNGGTATLTLEWGNANAPCFVNAGTKWADYQSYGAISATDLGGNRRAAAGNLDIGCYESLPPTGTVIILR